MHILLIEPDDELAQQYKRAFAVFGTSTTVARTAQKGVHTIDEHAPDAIVLELMLGGHNGLEFLYELRSYTDVHTIPIILHTYVSSSQFTSDEALLSELGVVAYLEKTTTSLSQLVSSVHRATKSKVI